MPRKDKSFQTLEDVELVYDEVRKTWWVTLYFGCDRQDTGLKKGYRNIITLAKYSSMLVAGDNIEDTGRALIERAKAKP